MLRLYVTNPVTALETGYAAKLRADLTFEPGTKVANGEADSGDVMLDDLDLTLDWEVEFASGRRVRLTEDASGSEKTLLVGRILSKEFDRGTLPLARQLTLTIADANYDLQGIPVQGWVRPAETGRARALALRTAYLNGSSSTALNPLGGRYARDSTVIASTYMQNAGNVTMPAETYDATDPLSVLRACAEFENKRLGVYINDNGTLALYYAPKAETAQLTCAIGVSDDPSDFGNPNYFEPHWIAGPALHTDADELLSGALMIHPNGVTYDRRAAVENVHDRWEEALYSQLPSGASELSGLLDARQAEQPRRSFGIQVPAARVHQIKAGMRIEIKRALASAVATPIFERIVSVHLAWLSPSEDHTYIVIITLETPLKMAATWPRPAPSPFRRAVGGAVSDDWELTIVYTTPDLETNIGILAGLLGKNYCYFFTTNTTPPFTVGHWALQTQTVDPITMDYFAVGGTIPIGVPFTIVMGVSGGNCYARCNSGILVKPAGSMGALSSRIEIGITTTRSGSPAAWQGFVESIASRAGMIDDFQRVVGPGGTAAGWGAASAGGSWVNGSGGAPFISSVDGSQGKMISGGFPLGNLRLPITQFTGQLVATPGAAYYGEAYGAVQVAIADGLASSWTLPYPTAYVPGTLQVYVDGVRQTATETSPTAGTFSLPWIPALGDQVSASWRVPAVV